MISMVLLGSGNVAQHLIASFLKSETVKIVQVFARDPSKVNHLIDNENITSNYSALKKADIYLIAVSDNAIASVSDQLPFEERLVVHTSGSMPMTILNEKNKRGVFYPLQTFTKNKAVNFKEIPICLESEEVADYKILEKAAEAISEVTYPISGEQRQALHVAAVFVCNFVNHLYEQGHAICQENNLPFSILQPLIKETASKIEFLSPAEAQTGPAKRRDTLTINAHLAFLKDKNQQEIYKLLTKSILDHGKKL
ncbi:Rossmann-like and DUF2520 domain-containing protein [Flavobacterium sp.]|uniref:Rossmann-like and DUF2520 domain-containing protein n=1 Tax=Flavobacterium sp. TaxID=239 RepID=UPI002604425B|nr:Rossmann-like and DUF2520 domain-containing protein [Flavobacterium sp.]MDD2986567.1 DUF2520 domain-containing protein [Flavobacterium sp.]